MADDPQDIIDELLGQNKELDEKNKQLTNDFSAYANSNKDGNLIQYQLDSNELLERLEHFYKGEYLGQEGENVGWITPEDDDQIPFNAFGVSSLMEIVSKYIDRNTSLSNYPEKRIYEILADLGDELNLFILSNYEKMGLDNNFKKTKFRLIVVTTLHMIESTYRRAIGGSTSRDLNQSRIINQSDTLRMNDGLQSPQRKFSITNPKTWGY